MPDCILVIAASASAMTAAVSDPLKLTETLTHQLSGRVGVRFIRPTPDQSRYVGKALPISFRGILGLRKQRNALIQRARLNRVQIGPDIRPSRRSFFGKSLGFGLQWRQSPLFRMNPALTWTDHFELPFECGLALQRRPHPAAEGCSALARLMHDHI